MDFVEERKLFAAADMYRGNKPGTRDRPALGDYSRILRESKGLILLLLALALLAGGLTELAMRPLYEANLLIQIADSAAPAPKSFLGEAGSVFDIKTPTTAEMEIMRSRMVTAPAVDEHQLLVEAKPRYFPVIGAWLARHTGSQLPLGLSKVADRIQGAQSIKVTQFDVPRAWQGKTFTLKAEGQGRYSLHNSSMTAPWHGTVGQPLVGSLPDGVLTLNVAELQGRTGSEFSIRGKSRLEAIEELQKELKLQERGRQSGIIEATFRDTDAARAAGVLNTIGATYVRQNLDRKSAEAEKSLAFLETQLPGLKSQMERAEGAYNAYRSRRGSVSLPEEARLVLERTASLRGTLLEAQQQRRDMASRLGEQHPALRTLNEQISALEREIRGLQGRAREMPSTEQNALRLGRDVQVSTDLYQQLRNNALQLQLVREGRTGNARIIDPAVPPDEPVRPKPALVLGSAAVAGLVLSLLAVLLRAGLARGVTSVRELEAATGLNVYSSPIPASKAQRQAEAGLASEKILALRAPSDPAVESLRQLRTVLQHQMRDRKNNRLLITGPAAGVGVHFVAANLAAVFAAGGKRILLVDANPQHGALNAYFRTARAPGLAELIVGRCTRQQATKVTGICRLDFIPAGSSPLSSAGLAVSPAFLDFLEQASIEYETVLLAAPPVLRSAETMSMATAAATVLLVARARKTAIDEITQSAHRLSQAGQFVSGVILNGTR